MISVGGCRAGWRKSEGGARAYIINIIIATVITQMISIVTTMILIMIIIILIIGRVGGRHLRGGADDILY